MSGKLTDIQATAVDRPVRHQEVGIPALIERLERYACSWVVGDALSEQRAYDMDKAAEELRHLTQSGIVEVAVRNPSVMDYITHWEDRATKAEAALAAWEPTP